MSARVIAMYIPPRDTDAFDKYYFAHHVPLAKKFPGLTRYEVSSGKVTDMTGASPYHLAAMLTFNSLRDVQSALTSAAGVATAADLQNFAFAGVSLLIFESKEI